MIRRALFIVLAVVAASMAPVAQAGVTFAFEANSAASDPLFTFDGSTLAADNNVDFTIDINGAGFTHDDVEFDFSATLASTMAVGGMGTLYIFEDVSFSFTTAAVGEIPGVLIVSAAFDSAVMFLGTGLTATAVMVSSPDGDIYTAGPVLTAELASVAAPMELLTLDFNQDFSFALNAITPADDGWTANSSYVGTSEILITIVPLPQAYLSGIALLGLMGLQTRRKHRLA